MIPKEPLYKAAGVDTAAAQSGLYKIIERIKQTWPAPGSLGTVKMDIGYFANVIDIGGIGLAICTDGVGSKSIIAGQYAAFPSTSSRGTTPSARIFRA